MVRLQRRSSPGDVKAQGMAMEKDGRRVHSRKSLMGARSQEVETGNFLMLKLPKVIIIWNEVPRREE